MEALANRIDEWSRTRPEQLAFISEEASLTWSAYAARSDRFGALLLASGIAPGERVAIMLPDGPGVHVAFVGCEKAGIIVMGIGPKAGDEELRHLIQKSGASALVTRDEWRGEDMASRFRALREDLPSLRVHIAISGQLDPDDACYSGFDLGPVDPGLRLTADDLFLLNSTSGTTGLPKCVTHHQARWFHFHDAAVESGEMTGDDIFLSALPAPFGFGLWTAHFTPAALGAPCVILEHFTAESMIAAIERHRVTVLAAVSTQFIMMLNATTLGDHDLSSLRALYTGGEAVPYERAAEFEERTGASVLQFYGSNETGALSRTTTTDTRDKRLRTAGQLLDNMNVRLFDDAGNDVTSSGEGQPGCKGPLASRGYWDDDDANAKLFTDGGWILTGDICRVDDEGYLSVVGRTADFIIRGGKNISGPAVEDAVGSHPDVALAAAVAMPDPVFGERVCVYVEQRPGRTDELGLDELVTHLKARGVTREWHPERLIVVPELPRASGGKVAKGALRQDIRKRVAAEAG